MRSYHIEPGDRLLVRWGTHRVGTVIDWSHVNGDITNVQVEIERRFLCWTWKKRVWLPPYALYGKVTSNGDAQQQIEALERMWRK